MLYNTTTSFKIGYDRWNNLSYCRYLYKKIMATMKATPKNPVVKKTIVEKPKEKKPVAKEKPKSWWERLVAWFTI